MSRLPAPENPVLNSEPALLVQSSLDSKSIASEDRPRKSGKGTVLISSLSKDEPIVTRKELWSYYCEFLLFDSILHLKIIMMFDFDSIL